jgi:hypothetical protein
MKVATLVVLVVCLSCADAFWWGGMWGGYGGMYGGYGGLYGGYPYYGGLWGKRSVSEEVPTTWGTQSVRNAEWYQSRDAQEREIEDRDLEDREVEEREFVDRETKLFKSKYTNSRFF